MSKSLFIRTDASVQVGSGHIMRCIALAQAWKKQERGYVIFITNCENESLRNRITDEGFKLVKIKESYPAPTDFETTLSTIKDSPSIKPWVVLDGYYFDNVYQLGIKKNNTSLLVIDDKAHLNHYVADIILNQNINAKELSYSCELGSKLLLGTDYVLLRDEFLTYKNLKRKSPKVAKKILITMGGSDPDNMSLKILESLNQIAIKGLEIKVVVGPNNLHLQSLKKASHKSKHNSFILQNVSNMSAIMAEADIAVSAAGSTSWELAFMGIPSILTVTADNQREIAYALDKIGFAINLGKHSKITSEKIKDTVKKLIVNNVECTNMSNCGRKLIDGKGKFKVTDDMKNYEQE